MSRKMDPDGRILVNDRRDDTWYRLIRTDDGLHIESISDRLFRRSLNPTDWKWVADVPPTIAARITNDLDFDQVASVLNSAISAMIEGAH